MPQRVLRIGAKFRQALERLRETDSDLARTIARASATLVATAESPLDVTAIVPPSGDLYFVRRVQGRNAWIWYRVTEVEVVLSRVTFVPPVPADDPTEPDDPSAAE